MDMKRVHRLAALRKFRAYLESMVDAIKEKEKAAEADVMRMFFDEDGVEKVSFRMQDLASTIAGEVTDLQAVFTHGGALLLEAPKKEITVSRKREVFASNLIPREDITIALAEEPLTAQFVKLAYSDQTLNKFLREREEAKLGIPPSLQHALAINERWKAGILGLGLRDKP